MDLPEIVEGTLNPDGTLILSQKPNLPPGPVVVTVQPIKAQTSHHDLADVIDEIHRGQRARGFQGRTPDEIETVRREGEAEYEQRMKSLRTST
jgi:hypothetical protein